jgi:hypothetical protein
MRYRTALLAALFVAVASAPAASQSNVRGRSWVERRDDWRWTRRPMTGSYRIRINPKFRQDLVDRAMERAARVRVMAEDRALMADRVRERVAERVRTARLRQLDRAWEQRERAEQRRESALRRQQEVRERVQDRMRFRFDDRFRFENRLLFRPRRFRVI